MRLQIQPTLVDFSRVSERWVQGCVTCLHSCVKCRCAPTDRRSSMWSVCGVPRHSLKCLICDALPLLCHLLLLKSLGLNSHFLPEMSVFSVVLMVACFSTRLLGKWSCSLPEPN